MQNFYSDISVVCCDARKYQSWNFHFVAVKIHNIVRRRLWPWVQFNTTIFVICFGLKYYFLENSRWVSPSIRLPVRHSTEENKGNYGKFMGCFFLFTQTVRYARTADSATVDIPVECRSTSARFQYPSSNFCSCTPFGFVHFPLYNVRCVIRVRACEKNFWIGTFQLFQTDDCVWTCIGKYFVWATHRDRLLTYYIFAKYWCGGARTVRAKTNHKNSVGIFQCVKRKWNKMKDDVLL